MDLIESKRIFAKGVRDFLGVNMPHDLLIATLKVYAVELQGHQLIANYLSDRKQ